MIVLEGTKVVHENKAALNMLEVSKENLIYSDFHSYLDPSYHEICKKDFIE
jgi:hypothetical protein